MNKVTIKYCPKCRWLLRSTWMAQELLITFEAEIQELSLKPSGVGVFEVIANDSLVWSRKEQQRFPEMKELKQLIRDVIAPDKSLGHSDKKN
ncbi:SelT/SelW/SelH family protein [Seonamhaeicola marinus]|uniref:SelT/SelW/SelH family protein n=1 Tax=Seonamhaeicola marinus TaxID=1912246 RepID=A0A5D0HVV6_9FLAO|nr:SelT/SelW/SelH family protein [Seonamhaeicola marinus]TYA75011.1 SelT/SelW/SelH family protein [Seonamhaeicola marinus]